MDFDKNPVAVEVGQIGPTLVLSCPRCSTTTWSESSPAASSPLPAGHAVPRSSRCRVVCSGGHTVDLVIRVRNRRVLFYFVDPTPEEDAD